MSATVERLPRHHDFIDALRGWAILLVLLLHTGQGSKAILAVTPWFTSATPDFVLPAALRDITDAGGNGVQLFFVVSALSLTLSLAASRAFRPGAYAMRRLLRIAPMFYAAGAFYLAWYGTGPRIAFPQGVALWHIVATAAFLHTWWPASFNNVVPGGWSIGVEAGFYAVLPFLLVAMRKLRTPMALAAVTAASLVATQILYHMFWRFRIVDSWWWPYTLPNSLAVFMCGIAAGLLLQRPAFAEFRLRPMAATASSLSLFALMVVGLPLLHLNNWYLQPELLFAPMAALLCLVLARYPTRLLVNPATIAIGRVSFSLYLVHFVLLAPAIRATRALLPADGSGVVFYVIYFAITFGLSFVVAAATYRWIELPFIRLGQRLSGRKAT